MGQPGYGDIPFSAEESAAVDVLEAQDEPIRPWAQVALKRQEQAVSELGDMTFSGREAELVSERLEQLLVPDDFAHQHEVARSIAGELANFYRRRVHVDAALDHGTALKAAQEVVLDLRMEQWRAGRQIGGGGGKGRHPLLVAWPGSGQHPRQLT